MNANSANPRILTGTAALPEQVRKTLFNTFVAVGIMFALTAASGWAFSGLRLGLWAVLGLFAVQLGALFAVHRFRNSSIGLALLALFSLLMGVTTGPLITHYLKLPGGASILGLSAGLTALATFGCATYAITTRRSFSQWGGMLFAGTLVIVVAALVNLFVQMPALSLTIGVLGALIFTAWILYDVSSVVTGAQDNYISAATGLYLDILNLFLSLLRIFGVLPFDD